MNSQVLTGWIVLTLSICLFATILLNFLGFLQSSQVSITIFNFHVLFGYVFA